MQAAAQRCLHMMWSKKQTSAAKAKASARGNSLALCLRSPAANLRQALPANPCVQLFCFVACNLLAVDF